MHFSLTRFLQWGGIAIVLLAIVGLNYDFKSEARVQMNTSVEDSLSQGMRGYWKLDDGSGTNATDSSGNANTLAMTGSPGWVTGNIGPSALDFSGSGQYLSVADPSSGVLDMADGASFTLTGWFNRDTFTADHTIVAKKNSQSTNTDDGYIVWVDDADDLIHFRADENGSTDSYTMASSTAFTATGWHHFAISWNDSVGMNIYVDGANNNGTASGTFANVGTLANSVAFAIGAESDGGNPFDGKLDDIRVYGNALSAEEVKKLYNTTAPTEPVDTSLVGHWTFDGMDVKGTTAIDKSGHGNDGAITGATKTIGKLGQGLQFNGASDQISASSIPWSGSLSFSFWVKTFDDTGFILSWGNYVYCRIGLAPYKLDCSVDSESHYTVSNNNISDGEWHHVVYTSSSSNQYLYIDNVLNDSSSSTPNGSTTTVTLGNSSYNGYLDDVRIYDDVLSTDEILTLYKMGI